MSENRQAVSESNVRVFSEGPDVVSDLKLDSDNSWELFLAKHKERDVVCGITTRVAIRDRYDAMAYVDLGGVQGAIDAQNVNWSRGPALPEMGQKVYCPILRFDTETKTVDLGQAILNWEQWQGVEKRLPVGTRHRGIVRMVFNDDKWELAGYVELEPSVHGYVKSSELQRARKAGQPSDWFSEGQEIEVVVQSIPQYPAQLEMELGFPR